MNVTVMSRSRAISYCHQRNTRPTVMISISDPYIQYSSSPFISPDNRIVEIINLSFADADAPGIDVYGREAAVSDLMQPADGQIIKSLLDRHPNTDIIVHCDAGISRSAGVAAAILKAKTGDDGQIYDCPFYHPNSHCYRTTLNALLFSSGAD